MKRKVKILILAISICAMMFALAISSSATTASYVSSNYNVQSSNSLDYGNSIDGTFAFARSSGGEIYIIDNVEAFQSYVGEMTYSEFTALMDEKYSETGLPEYSYLLEAFGFTEAVFNHFMNYGETTFTQEDLDTAVSEALEDAGLALTSDIFVYQVSGTLADGYSFNSGYLFDFGDYQFVKMQQATAGDIEDEAIFVIVYGARAFYEDISTNVDDKNEIFKYLYSKRVEFSMESSSDYALNEGKLYYALAESFVEVFTEEDLQAKYNEGKTDGVIEYKSSEEYTNTINLAKSAGVDEYKTSEEYASILNTKYNEGHAVGTSAGMIAYKSSTEYKESLSAEYNKGYDAGFTDGENAVNFAPIIIGIVFLATVAITLIFINQKRKKSYRR